MTAQNPSTAAPATHGQRGRHPSRGAAHRPARHSRAEDVADRARLAVGDHERLAVHRPARVDRGDQGVGRVVDVRGVDQRGARADQRQPAAPGARRRAAPPIARRRGPRPGAGAPPARRMPASPPRWPPARPPPWIGSSSRAPRPDRLDPAPAPNSGTPPCATDGDETCTIRGTPSAAQAARTFRVPPMLTRAYSAHRPVTSTLAARWTTASCPLTARRTSDASATSPSTSAHGSPEERRCRTVTSSPRASSRCTVTRPRSPLAPVTSTLTSRVRGACGAGCRRGRGRPAARAHVGRSSIGAGCRPAAVS